MFYGRFLLPENLAKKAFKLIEEDPSFAKDMLARLDSDTMESQEEIMPKVDKIIIIPEGKATEALARNNPSNKYFVTGINPDYVKECPKY